MTFTIKLKGGGGTGQSDLVDAVDSSGHPTLTSAPSNSSGGGGGSQYPPWRSNYKGDYRDEPDQPLCTRDLLCWAFQIARGMDYLARRKVISIQHLQIFSSFHCEL